MYTQQVVSMTAETQTQEWTKEFDEEMRHNEGEGLEDDGGFWCRLEQTWEGLAQENSSSHPWLTKYEKEQQEYKWVWLYLYRDRVNCCMISIYTCIEF